MKFATFQKSLENFLDTYQFKKSRPVFFISGKDFQPVEIQHSEYEYAKRRAGRIIFRARQIVQQAKRHKLFYVRLITLTFANDSEFSPDALKRFLYSMRKRFNRAKLPYLFFSIYEVGSKTRRLHVHIVFYTRISPAAYRIFTHSELKRLWPYGFVWISKPLRGHKSYMRVAVQYAVKYVYKRLRENYVIQKALKAFGKNYRSCLYSCVRLFRRGLKSEFDRMQREIWIFYEKYIRFFYTPQQYKAIEADMVLQGAGVWDDF